MKERGARKEIIIITFIFINKCFVQMDYCRILFNEIEPSGYFRAGLIPPFYNFYDDQIFT